MWWLGLAGNPGRLHVHMPTVYSTTYLVRYTLQLRLVNVCTSVQLWGTRSFLGDLSVYLLLLLLGTVCHWLGEYCVTWVLEFPGYILLISRMLLQTIWLWNHISHTKVYFNEFVANALRDNVIIFDLVGCGGWYRPKTSYLGAHFGALTQRLVHPWVPVLFTKDLPRNEISNEFQSPYLEF